MSNPDHTTVTYSKTFGADHFEIVTTRFVSVRQTGGFNRLAYNTRATYYMNGRRQAKAVWMVCRDVAAQDALTS